MAVAFSGSSSIAFSMDDRITSYNVCYTKLLRFFSSETQRVHAVDSVSIDVPPGKTVGLVGESGCGKTTLGRVAIRLLPPDAGRVIFEGLDITALSGEELRRIRKKMQIRNNFV